MGEVNDSWKEHAPMLLADDFLSHGGVVDVAVASSR